MLRRSRRALLAIVVTAIATSALAACGSGSGGSSASYANEQAKPAGQILRDVRAVVANATSVHMSGRIAGTMAITIDLHLSQTGGTGTVSSKGLAFKLTRIGKAAYFTGNPGFYRHFTNTAGINLLDGKWLKVPVSNTHFSPYTDLTDMASLLGAVLKPAGNVVKAGMRTLHGVRAVGLRDEANAGTLYVAANGVPYPIEIVTTGTHAGVVTFDHWNQQITLDPPAHPVYLTQLARASGISLS
ncbi:MAG TPA: hypothetical protein VGL44_06275 [Gaiellales bacterium]